MKDLQAVVDRVSHRYAAMCWWADLNDLKQEGWVAALEAKTRWKPEGGASLATYAEVAIVCKLRTYLWKSSAPVSFSIGGGRKPPETRALSFDMIMSEEQSSNLPGKLAGERLSTVRRQVDQANEDTSAVEMWLIELRTRMREVIAAGLNGELAAAVLLDGESATSVANRAGKPPRAVWYAAHQARKRLKIDVSLHEWMRDTSGVVT